MIMIDMKMPKCCFDCPILQRGAWCEAYCPFVHENNLMERLDRPSECPLKEIEESELRSSEKSNNQDQMQKTMKGTEIITKQQALDILSCRPDLNYAEILALNILKSDYIDCTEIVQSAVDRGLEAVIKSVREVLQLESTHTEKAINLEKQSSEPTVTYKGEQVKKMALEFIYNYKTKSEGKI